MNIKNTSKIKAELLVIDMNDLKPNYAALGRKYEKDYRTIKKYHNGYEGKAKTRNKPSKLDDYKGVIENKISIKRVTLKAVYEFLVQTYGKDTIGSYSNFKYYCNKHGLKTKANISSSGNNRYETDIGDMAQADWKESIELTSRSGEVFVINIFHLILKYSRYSYIELTLSRDQNTVFRCLINAIKYYGGVPNRILFDNMSTVVDINVKPKRINSKMKHFSNDIGFKIETCKARHPFTKGTNEARNKILDWIRCYDKEFDTIEDLIDIVEKIRFKMNTEVCQGIDVSPSLLFYKEKEYLNPLPNSSVLEQYISPNKILVSRQQLVSYKGIKYSVDKKFIGKYVQPEELDDKLLLYYKGNLIQIHQISENPINYTEKHYRQTLNSISNLQNFDNIVENNLKIMDSLLESRKVTITKNEAIKSDEAMIAYLISNDDISKHITKYLQSLSKEDRKRFLDEMKKLLPFIINEKEFFNVFQRQIYNEVKRNVHLSIIDFWILDFTGHYDILTIEGSNAIKEEYEDEIINILEHIHDDMEEG